MFPGRDLSLVSFGWEGQSSSSSVLIMLRLEWADFCPSTVHPSQLVVTVCVPSAAACEKRLARTHGLRFAGEAGGRFFRLFWGGRGGGVRRKSTSFSDFGRIIHVAKTTGKSKMKNNNIVIFRHVRKIAKSDFWLRDACPHGTTRLPLDGFS